MSKKVFKIRKIIVVAALVTVVMTAQPGAFSVTSALTALPFLYYRRI